MGSLISRIPCNFIYLMSNKTHARKTDCVSFALIAASKHPLKEEILLNPLAFRRGETTRKTKTSTIILSWNNERHYWSEWRAKPTNQKKKNPKKTKQTTKSTQMEGMKVGAIQNHTQWSNSLLSDLHSSFFLKTFIYSYIKRKTVYRDIGTINKERMRPFQFGINFYACREFVTSAIRRKLE